MFSQLYFEIRLDGHGRCYLQRKLTFVQRHVSCDGVTVLRQPDETISCFMFLWHLKEYHLFDCQCFFYRKISIFIRIYTFLLMFSLILIAGADLSLWPILAATYVLHKYLGNVAGSLALMDSVRVRTVTRQTNTSIGHYIGGGGVVKKGNCKRGIRANSVTLGYSPAYIFDGNNNVINRE